MAKKKVKAPDHLTEAGAALWLTLYDDYYLHDSAQELLLTGLVESWELISECRQALAEKGVLITNPDSGNMRANPAGSVLRDARVAFHRALSMLGVILPAHVDQEGDDLLEFFARGRS